MNTKSRFIVEANHLEAVAIAASTEETRYYLNGVHFERYADGSVGLIATDGHRLHTMNAKRDAEPVDRFTLPTEQVNIVLQLAKAHKKMYKTIAELVAISIEHDGKLGLTGFVGLHDRGDERPAASSANPFSCKAIDGSFPDWRRVFPSTDQRDAEGDQLDLSVREIGFNANYVNDFGKCVALITGVKHARGVAFEFTGPNSPAIIKIGSSKFVGVLMPMRV